MDFLFVLVCFQTLFCFMSPCLSWSQLSMIFCCEICPMSQQKSKSETQREITWTYIQCVLWNMIRIVYPSLGVVIIAVTGTWHQTIVRLEENFLPFLIPHWFYSSHESQHGERSACSVLTVHIISAAENKHTHTHAHTKTKACICVFVWERKTIILQLCADHSWKLQWGPVVHR